MWEEQNQEISKWENLLANDASLKPKWIVVLQNILQMKLCTCNINLTSYIIILKSYVLMIENMFLFHCQFTSYNAKE